MDQLKSTMRHHKQDQQKYFEDTWEDIEQEQGMD